MPHDTRHPDRIARPPRGAGFTLVELLVTISIIVVLLGITVGGLNYMLDANRIESGIQTVSVAAATARAYATREISSFETDTFTHARYTGVALLFTPADEIRLVETDQRAMSTGSAPLQPVRNGYRDIRGRDYIRLPAHIGVFGIGRNSSTAVQLYSPPFAVRFNEHGQLIPGQPFVPDDKLHKVVFYDGNYDGQYEANTGSGTRTNPFGGAPYNPEEWDPTSEIYQANDDDSSLPGMHPGADRYKLPFERMEAVIALVVYDKRQFRMFLAREGLTFPDVVDDADEIGEWLFSNGRVVRFNRNTGTMMR